MVNYPLLILSLKKKGRVYILGIKLSRGCMAADSRSQQFEMYNHILKHSTLPGISTYKIITCKILVVLFICCHQKVLTLIYYTFLIFVRFFHLFCFNYIPDYLLRWNLLDFIMADMTLWQYDTRNHLTKIYPTANFLNYIIFLNVVKKKNTQNLPS